MSDFLTRPPTVLSIQSQVVTARVGNSVAAFAMERLGVRVLQLPTALLGRRPDRGAPGGGPIPAARFATLVEALAADDVLADVDAVLTGYVGAADQAPLVLDLVEHVKASNPKALFVCDPVLGDDGRTYVDKTVADAVVQSLVQRADWLTPNAYELGVITGRTIETLDDARHAARRLGKPTLVSSIRTATGIGNLLSASGGEWFCETPRLPRAPKGTGDLLSALFVARRVRGEAPAVALEGASGSLYDVIVRSLAADSDDLLLPQAQDVLTDPVTWPRARPLE
ncbi:MAG: pyridoxal kinase [Hyphomonadaceae bacterium]|nr:pyridoxal kinase [Hyphomonadaceae bacterium]